MKPAPPVMRIVAISGQHEPRQHDNTTTKLIGAFVLSCVRAFVADPGAQLNSGALRVLKRQPELLRQRIHRRAAPLPRALGLEPQIADAAAPRRDDAADRPEVGAIRVLL